MSCKQALGGFLSSRDWMQRVLDQVWVKAAPIEEIKTRELVTV
jgi:hypothetical protein